VVLTFFTYLTLFVEWDYQIYSQYTQWRSFIENTKLTNRYSL